MKIKGIPEKQLRRAVKYVSQRDYDGNITFKREPDKVGNYLHFTLTVKSSSAIGGRRSLSGRKVSALCWHGHRDVMQAIFSLYPEAILVTVLARYEGLEDFERKFEQTGDTNIGSMVNPLLMFDACEC